MNRPRDRRFDPHHPHNLMLTRRFKRRVGRVVARLSTAGALDVPAMTRERYEAIQATLPVADRIPW